MEFLYSIIIPHRNSVNLLKRAVSSIPKRDDVEIIIIDNSSNICDFTNVLALNKNVKIFYSEESRGAGGARNVGLSKATGKWVLFMDADDFFTKNAFKFFDEYSSTESEIVYFKVSSVYSDTLEVANRDTYINLFIDNYLKNSCEKNENKLRYLLDVPWAKMIKRELIENNNVLFDECIACNDAFFSTKVGYYAHNISVSTQTVYCVTVQAGSITNTKSLENLESRLLANLRIQDFLNKNKIPVQRKCVKYLFEARTYGIKAQVRFIKYLNLYSYNILSEVQEYLNFLKI